jgi:hypothetical protein
MKKSDLGLTGKNLKTLEKIEDKILKFDDLDERMDYVDEIVLWTRFPDLSDNECDNIDEYLRDFVSNSM